MLLRRYYQRSFSASVGAARISFALGFSFSKKMETFAIDYLDVSFFVNP